MDESRICCQFPQPLSAECLTEPFPKPIVEIIASNDVVNGGKGDTGNIPSSKFLTLTCWVDPESCKTGEKKRGNCSEFFLSAPYSNSQLSTGNWDSKYKYLIFVTSIPSIPAVWVWVFPAVDPEERQWLLSFWRWSQETWSMEWGREMEKGEVGRISLPQCCGPPLSWLTWRPGTPMGEGPRVCTLWKGAS